VVNHEVVKWKAVLWDVTPCSQVVTKVYEDCAGSVLLFYHDDGGKTFIQKMVTMYRNKRPDILEKNYPHGFSYTKVSSFTTASIVL
jgi:hypothetical protein